jgi:hypothetical protein
VLEYHGPASSVRPSSGVVKSIKETGRREYNVLIIRVIRLDKPEQIRHDMPSNRVIRQGFCIKLEIFQKSLPIYHTFLPQKDANIQGLFRPKSSSRP